MALSVSEALPGRGPARRQIWSIGGGKGGIGKSLLAASVGSSQPPMVSDPRYNVMDRLDTYIDDYGKPDPLPAGMLRKMASAQFMKLVPEPRPESDTVAGHAQDPAEAGGPEVQTEVVAQSPLSSPNAAVSAPHHDHPDLQLQPDLAPADPDPGSRPG